MTGRSSARAVLTLLVIAPLIGACGGEAARPEPPADVAYADDASGGDDAGIGGRLTLIDGCLRLQVDGGAVVPIFPDRGIVWDGDVLKVGGQEFPLDVDLTLHGGGYEGAAPEAATIPAACRDAEAFWIVNLD